MILTLKSKPSYNHSPNFLESNFKSSTIEFGDPYCLTLLGTWTQEHTFANQVFKNMPSLMQYITLPFPVFILLEL